MSKTFEEKAQAVPSATEMLDTLMGRLEREEGDIIYPAGDVLGAMECGPGKITMLGAGPGLGKTTLSMQYLFGAMEADPDLHVCIANAEMSFESLLKREISRRSGLPARAIRFADLTPGQLTEAKSAANEIRPFLSRMNVMPPPFNIESLAKFTDAEPAGLLMLDYLQKFSAAEDPRIGANEVMSHLRGLAFMGWGVFAISALTRGRGKNGSTHDSTQSSLASFKESGEIEYNANVAYLLRDMGPVDEADTKTRKITVDCVKNRDGETVSLDLIFNMRQLSFESLVLPFEEFSDYSGDNPYQEAKF